MRLVLTVMLAVVLSAGAMANGLSLNSIGTRALGMGGAFVGLADDPTAIYWNPAGLAGQPSSVMVFATDIIPTATYKMDLMNIDAKTESNHYIAPNAFFNYNMDKLSLAIGVYVPAGLGAEWNYNDFNPMVDNLKFSSKIGVVNISPGIAYKVTDQFSVGAAFNIYYAMFDMYQPAGFDSDGDGNEDTFFQFEESSTGLGYGVTLGLKYDVNEMFALGATFRTKTTVTMSGTAKNPLFPALPNFPPVVTPGPGESDFDRDVAWPTWIAGGVAVKPSEKLTITADAQYSAWSENKELVAEYKDTYWDAVMTGSGQDKFELKWEDAIQYRLGLQYLASENLLLRGGYYYDPAPAPDETVNVLFPSSTNHTITAGGSYIMDNFTLDLALEYLFGAERDIEVNATNEMPGIHQMDIFAFSLGFGYVLP